MELVAASGKAFAPLLNVVSATAKTFILLSNWMNSITILSNGQEYEELGAVIEIFNTARRASSEFRSKVSFCTILKSDEFTMRAEL